MTTISAPGTGDAIAHVAETPGQKSHGPSTRETAGGRRVVGIVLRILLCLVFGLPLLFMIVSSFKPDLQIFSDLGSPKAFLPVGNISLDNYTAVFNRVPFAQFMINSI